MRRRPPGLLLPALLLLLGSISTAFLFQLQGQHSQPRPTRPRPRHWHGQQHRARSPLTSAAAGDDDGDGNEEDGKPPSPSSGGGSIKPRAFTTKRMRRGPLGPTASSPSKSPTAPPATAAAQQQSTAASGVGAGPAVLKLSKQWACVAGCGACCYLAPEERPFLMDYFEDPEDLAQYNAMVGDDGWCVPSLLYWIYSPAACCILFIV